MKAWTISERRWWWCHAPRVKMNPHPPVWILWLFMVSSFPDVVLRPLSSGRSMPTNVKAAAFEPLVLKGSRKISSGGESVVTNHSSVFSFSAAVSGFSAGIHFSFFKSSLFSFFWSFGLFFRQMLRSGLCYQQLHAANDSFTFKIILKRP